MNHFMDKTDIAIRRLCLALYPKAPIPLVVCPEKKVGGKILLKRGNPPPGCNDYYANTRYVTSLALWAIMSKLREPEDRRNAAMAFREWAEPILKPSYG
eukprot:2793830-Karenia_brevis.AAC.1